MIKLIAAGAITLGAALTGSTIAQNAHPMYTYSYFEDGVRVGDGVDECLPGPYVYTVVTSGYATDDFVRQPLGVCTWDGQVILV